MPRITGWSLTAERNVSDVRSISGTVREWEHTSGDTVSVVLIDEEDEERLYQIRHNGSIVTARGTLQKAIDNARTTLENHPDGLDS